MTTKKVSSKKKTMPAKQAKQTESERYATISLSASYMGAILADSFTSTILPKAELADVTSALSDKIKTIQTGDMQPIEAMLISQAQALQTMFVTLGRMAANKTQLAQYTAFMNKSNAFCYAVYDDNFSNPQILSGDDMAVKVAYYNVVFE